MCAKRSNDRHDDTTLASLDPNGNRAQKVRQHDTGFPLYACVRAVRIQRGHSSCHGIRKKAAGTRADGSNVTLRNVAQRLASPRLDLCISSMSAQRLQDGLDGASVNGPFLVVCIKRKRSKRGTAGCLHLR